MAHGFVREMLDAEPQNFRLTLGACLFGGLLLGVSYLALLVFDQVELSAIVSLAAVILLISPLIYNELKDLWVNRLEMNELAALSFIVSLGSTQYQTAAMIAFFLVGAQLIQDTIGKIWSSISVEAFYLPPGQKLVLDLWRSEPITELQ